MNQPWQVKTLSDCIEKTGTVTKIPKKVFLDAGKYPVVSQEKDLINGYWDDEADVLKVAEPLVVFGDHTQVLKHIDFDFVVGADGVKLLKPKSFLDSRYFFYYLLANPLKSLGYARHYRLLKDLDIRFPEIPEQKRIVAILDEAFAGIDAAIANTEINLANARELFESYLDSIFSRRDGKWQNETLGNLVALARGHNPPKSKFIYEPRKGYVRFYQIRDGKSDNYAVYVPDSPKLHKVEPEDILMVAYRHIGKVFRGASGAFNVALCKLTNKDRSVLLDDYLYYLIPTKYVRGELLKQSERSLIPSMSVKHLSDIQIPLPPITDQKILVEQLDQMKEEVQRLENIYQEKLNSLEELKQSLLHMAFSGELTSEPDTLKDEAVA
jgi:type I restriction enzyme S subunit